ncbi:imelysin family protein [Chitinibacter sp. S2-10]|uniref:imelysin family protein n=1 Tax=Chitinibacter sp. S2-10 TaxID=3373597 RepID=UPI0039773681
MNKLTQTLLAFSFLATLNCVWAEDDAPSGAMPDIAAAQAWLDQGYLPRHASLTQAADQLASSAAALCTQPDAAKLTQTRTAWLAASTAWRSLDGAPAGPMVLARLGRKIDFRPIRLPELNSAIAGGEGNVAAQGLAAAEYLLWGDGVASSSPAAILASLKTPARCDYLAKISRQIATETHTLDEGWRIYRAELGAENPFFRQNMYSEHVNLMLASLTGLLKRMPTADEVNADQFVEWRSGSEKAQFLAQFAGFAQAIEGINLQLEKDGEAALAKAMRADIAQARSLCGALPTSLAKASGKARSACYKAVQQSKARLQNQIAEKLDLSLGFTEGDGD